MKNKLIDLDLNLLRILKAVVETHNTHAAAELLGISQTSVSRALAKLRETFGDQLFIRKAHGVEPSELAEKLAEAADEMLAPIQKVVDAYQRFDPNTHQGEVNIALNIYLLEVYGNGILSALKQALPAARFNIQYWQDSSLADVLDGNTDYLIHFSTFPLPKEVYQHKLQDIKLSLVARKAHPVLSQSCEWQDIHSLPLARLIIDGINAKHSPVEILYQSKGYQANFSLITHSVSMLLEHIATTDSILFGSSYMKILNDKIAAYPLPLMPKEMTSVSISGGYLQAKRGFPLNQYIHQVMQTFFDSVEQPN
ncbi:LysR family transcriptional regulator [Motilimonas sp. KMU-193]|uniref:LysR family transcriptional regulator n=1 Tax=Motilimonas sp. KMU-193 TaxID=3388668 RepID=UPI00396B0F63